MPLRPEVWKDAGNPSKTKRVTILARLRRMPDLVTLQADPHVMFHYRAEKGPVWLQIEKGNHVGVGDEEDDEG
ncbi:MAG TPA: hypothetical protein VFE60_27045 [Roseiarcus sp.]|nr:hypothetical protein [Roseiarcus sp.]